MTDPNGWIDPPELNGCVTTVGRKAGGTESAYNNHTGQGIYVLRDPITKAIRRWVAKIRQDTFDIPGI